MSTKEIHIEKYDIDSWEKEQKPYAMILTDVIQRIPPERMREAFLWIFLESLAPTWSVNKHHIMQHFDISDRTYERWMSWLNTVKLIEYRQNRNGGGSFGKGKLIVLSGSRFSPDAECNGTVKIGGTAVNKKKAKVIHISDGHRDAKIGGTVKPSTDRAGVDDPGNSPNRQKTEPRSNGAHINTTKIITKDKKKTNTPVSVFSDTESVKTHFEIMLGRKSLAFDEDTISQGVYWAWDFQTEENRTFDQTCKRLNFCIKAFRNGTWRIPQGWNGISSQSIREKEERDQAAKKEQYAQEAQAFRQISEAVSTGKPYVSIADRVAAYKDSLNANQGTMPEKTVSTGN